jgi:hypothetical protein
MGGRHGSKGAILSRFVIDDSSLCFINCHLAAGQSHRRQRDRDLVDILEEKASFGELSSSPGAYVPGANGELPFDHELIFLSGDLNYRVRPFLLFPSPSPLLTLLTLLYSRRLTPAATS